MPGQTGLSRDAPLLLGGTGGALTPLGPSPIPALFPESVQDSQATQDAPSTKPLAEETGGLLHATPFTLEQSEMSCTSSWRLFRAARGPAVVGALDDDDDKEEEDDEEEDAPDLDRATWFRLEDLGLP